MPPSIPEHIRNLQRYLLQPSERNEDLAISFFRHLYGEKFKRQSDAANADGYVSGHFVLELKGNSGDWYSGLFQALAYERNALAFAVVVVCAKGFLAAWRKDDISEDVRSAILAETSAASTIGRKYAKLFTGMRRTLLRKAFWYRPEIEGELFLRTEPAFVDAIESFERALKDQEKVREPITLKNFVNKLEEMKPFFDPSAPIKVARAFYSMIYGPWDAGSTLLLSNRHDDRATLGGIEISALVPSKRAKFKAFVENHEVHLDDDENIDDFFSRYDEALDSVDRDFRIKHGIFFTDIHLAKFAMWLVKRELPDLGRNYLVIDPACGSGNLVTNWRSPLELRHKVVSEIEPELLYAVEQRMKGDQWHNGKFTVVPKVTENAGLNFLDKSAHEYIAILKRYLSEKGHKPNKPIAFLCNPPYRSDDDQAAGGAGYEIHSSIVELIGNDAASERYCCFLAQMKLICEAAADSGMPEESILMLFTKAAWLTKRSIFQPLRRQLLRKFEDLGGVLVNGKEFFDLTGTFPIAFTMWRYKGSEAQLDSERSIPLRDLTHLTRKDLKELPWNAPSVLDAACDAVLKNRESTVVHLGVDRPSIREWIGRPMIDFKRNRRAAERNSKHVGGLPLEDRRVTNVKAYGESDGSIVGFMDDLTPCRTSKGEAGFPWFRLNPQFMDVRKNRLYSGPPTHFGYSARTLEDAEKMFLWYALTRTFAALGYPMWADALELWAPELPHDGRRHVLKLAYAIGFAENECVETIFPAGNPVKSSIEIRAPNPMTSLNAHSFWSKNLATMFTSNGTTTADRLVDAVNAVFAAWKKELRGRAELIAEFERPYFVGEGKLTKDAGITQIRDYASERDSIGLLELLRIAQERLKRAKDDFRELILSKDGLDYFGTPKAPPRGKQISHFKPQTKFDHIVERRLALAAVLIDQSKDDSNFGLTKFAKVFYLADAVHDLGLKTNYFRQAAGPLDPRAIYNDKVGLIPLGTRHGYFETIKDGPLTKFLPRQNFQSLIRKADELLGSKVPAILETERKLAALDTQQSEIIATLYACWNDLLLDAKDFSDDVIVREFLKNWHPKKTQFPKARLLKALKWMRAEDIEPRGVGQRTSTKWEEPDTVL